MTPRTAMEVILGLLPLHVMSEAEIYRLINVYPTVEI
jgi:hypothetical protein